MAQGNRKKLIVVFLILASNALVFQNCGGGFKVSDPSVSGMGSLPIPTPSVEPSPTPSPTPGPSPTPTPTATPSPTVTGSWNATSVMGAPTARCQQAGAAVGNRLFVFGGVTNTELNAQSFPNDGALFDPVQNTWALLPAAANGPSARNFASAVYTGSSVIVWGGTFASPLNTGSILDLSNNTWKVMSTTGAPAGRNYHVAVWTGSKMIVFGGSTGFGASEVFLNTGAVYDPMTDAWMPMEVNGAPTVSGQLAGVWTGSKLVVWGGANAAQGGVYDPMTNTWATMVTSGAPSPRSRHGLFWTGSKVIVWGGISSTGTLLTAGGIYDPALNQWATMADSVSIGAVDQSMAFNGSRIVAFESQIGRGGIYDVAANRWDAMPATNGPSFRFNQTTAFVGDRVVTWGGCFTPQGMTTFTTLNTGAMFF